VEDRRTYIKVKALGKSLEAVKSAQDASRQMQAAWQKILSGDFSTAEIAAMLKETDELLAAVAALKAAEKPKAAP
jgi:chemotaxis regulatin CheY-phosphate phosphatase CheZ